MNINIDCFCLMQEFVEHHGLYLKCYRCNGKNIFEKKESLPISLEKLDSEVGFIRFITADLDTERFSQYR